MADPTEDAAIYIDTAQAVLFLPGEADPARLDDAVRVITGTTDQRRG